MARTDAQELRRQEKPAGGPGHIFRFGLTVFFVVSFLLFLFFGPTAAVEAVGLGIAYVVLALLLLIIVLLGLSLIWDITK